MEIFSVIKIHYSNLITVCLNSAFIIKPSIIDVNQKSHVFCMG